jgi:hypothetical protein
LLKTNYMRKKRSLYAFFAPNVDKNLTTSREINTMPIGKRQLTFVLSILLAFILVSVSCTQAAVSTPTAAPIQTELPQPTDLPPTQPPPTQAPTQTATSLPTSTSTATPSPSATDTPVPSLGVTEKGISAWCLPEHGVFAADLDPAQPPTDASIAEWTGAALEVRNLPSNGCVIVYEFNQPAPAGLTLEVSDKSGSKPFLTADLVPSASANIAYALLRHTMLIAPPAWNLSFTFVVKTSAGVELRNDPVNIHRWVPKLCWNGRPPNVFTLRCPLAQDLHPWDPSYGTPMPTSPPE